MYKTYGRESFVSGKVALRYGFVYWSGIHCLVGGGQYRRQQSITRCKYTHLRGRGGIRSFRLGNLRGFVYNKRGVLNGFAGNGVYLLYIYI